MSTGYILCGSSFVQRAGMEAEGGSASLCIDEEEHRNYARLLILPLESRQTQWCTSRRRRVELIFPTFTSTTAQKTPQLSVSVLSALHTMFTVHLLFLLPN